ncbi:MAG: DUF1295 domain-containing protein [Phycisphaerales bacterium JB041]
MSDTILNQLGTIGAGAGAVMIVLWLIQLRTRDAGVVDVGWAACLGASAVVAGLTGDGDPVRRALIAAIGGLWGLRLAWHLLTDRVLKGPEDGRYEMMRELFGARVQPVFLVFFLGQALLVVILCVPFLLAAGDPRPAPGLLDILALAVWITGIVGESVADHQLRAFKRDPDSTGKVCTRGLWRYSRHPNYFFEWCMWVAYAIMATAAPLGVLAWISPALILLFVLKLTGIPPTEARALRSRGDAYRRYQRTTNAFFPWFPRQEQTETTETNP